MAKTVAESLFADARVAQAKRLLAEALADHQKGLTGPRAAHPELKVGYDELLKQFAAARGGALYFPYLGSGVGRGSLVELADGSVKYDMIGGIGVHYFGHSSPLLLEAGVDAAVRDTVMQGNLQQNVESAKLARTLVDMANGGATPSPLAHCFLTTSGAMANENALKLAFQKHAPADRVLAFSHGFAGRSMALSWVTDKPAYRVGLPVTVKVDYVPFYDPAQPEHSTKAAVARLKEHLHRYPKQHACMWIELIQGEGGFYAGTREFFLPIVQALKEAGVAVWFDEIQTFARTTRPFAFQHFGLESFVDICSVGKTTQVCATLFADTYTPKPGLVSQTFTGGTSAILAAQAILDQLNGGAFFGGDGRVMAVRRRFMGHIDRLAAKGWLKGPYGEGAMIAFAPFDGTEATVKKLLVSLFDAGVIAFVCGAEPYRIRFLPSVGVVTDEDIDAVCAILEKVMSEHSTGK